MTVKGYLIDTNIISYFFQGQKEVYEFVKNSNIYISFITEMELKANPKLSKKERSLIDSFIKTCVIIDINNEIKQEAIIYIRNHKLKLPDAIIAATAYYLKLELISADEQFKKIGMPVITPKIKQ